MMFYVILYEPSNYPDVGPYFVTKEFEHVQNPEQAAWFSDGSSLHEFMKLLKDKEPNLEPFKVKLIAF